MFINHSSKQVTAKIVYYGPGLSGKTTNLQYIFSITNPKTRGELVSIETDIERTLFFDLLPINVGLVKGYQTKFQLYTVPGQVFYDSTRQLVLKGADGIVFIADSQELMENANLESFENLRANLSRQNQKVSDIPLVFQYNKQDLQNISPLDRLNEKLNHLKSPFFGAIAIDGSGVIETLREISSLTLRKIKGLLDQTHQYEHLGTLVKFDTDKKHEIIKREELPLKKISVKTNEDFHNSFSLDEYKSASAAPAPPAPPAPAAPAEVEEVAINENEEAFELKEFEEVPEIDKIDIDDIPEFQGFDDEIEIGMEEEEAFNDLEETDDLDLDGMGSPPRIFEVHESEETKELMVKKTPVPGKTTPEIDLGKVDVELKKEPKKAARGKQKSSAIDLLDKLKDDSRVTIIKKLTKLPKQDSPLMIEVKDKNSLLLDPIKLEITPGTRKITLILDVKR